MSSEFCQESRDVLIAGGHFSKSTERCTDKATCPGYVASNALAGRRCASFAPRSKSAHSPLIQMFRYSSLSSFTRSASHRPSPSSSLVRRPAHDRPVSGTTTGPSGQTASGAPWHGGRDHLPAARAKRGSSRCSNLGHRASPIFSKSGAGMDKPDCQAIPSTSQASRPKDANLAAPNNCIHEQGRPASLFYKQESRSRRRVGLRRDGRGRRRGRPRG